MDLPIKRRIAFLRRGVFIEFSHEVRPGASGAQTGYLIIYGRLV
jgi:hypothetical protein